MRPKFTITVLADALAPDGARLSASTVLTEKWACRQEYFIQQESFEYNIIACLQ